MRKSIAFAALLMTLPAGAAAQAAATTARSQAPVWEFAATLYGFGIPDGTSYLLPIVTADRGHLHVEGRYNYESLRSASLFVGWTVEGGEKLHAVATPIAGIVVGDLDGAAPGLELTLALSHFELYSEAEYVFDFAGRAGDYFYVWSEFTYGISPAWRAGLAAQRLRTTESGLSVDRGLMVGWQPGNWGASATAFDPFTPDVFYAISASVSF